MLVHICCSVDSHYFLEKLREEYPNEKLIGYFYDPNIHPYSEYKLRLLDVEYSCNKLGIELIEEEYNLEEWLALVKGLEDEPEKGERCTLCFEERLNRTFQKAKELGEKSFTTTLLISPKKSQDKLTQIGEKLESDDIKWIFKDYRAGNGMQLQANAVKENSLYRQNYCGCIFALSKQREQQNKLMDEMISPISQQVLPESIEERIRVYKTRNRLEADNKKYKIVKRRFLNYRLLYGKVSVDKTTLPSYILFFSTLRTKKVSGRIDFEFKGISHLNKDEVKIISIDTFNMYLNTNYNTVLELLYNAPEVKDELELREKISCSKYDLSTIIVLDEIQTGKYEIELDSIIYEDVKEVIV